MRGSGPRGRSRRCSWGVRAEDWLTGELDEAGWNPNFFSLYPLPFRNSLAGWNVDRGVQSINFCSALPWKIQWWARSVGRRCVMHYLLFIPR